MYKSTIRKAHSESCDCDHCIEVAKNKLAKVCKGRYSMFAIGIDAPLTDDDVCRVLLFMQYYKEELLSRLDSKAKSRLKKRH